MDGWSIAVSIYTYIIHTRMYMYAYSTYIYIYNVIMMVYFIYINIYESMNRWVEYVESMVVWMPHPNLLLIYFSAYLYSIYLYIMYISLIDE